MAGFAQKTMSTLSGRQPSSAEENHAEEAKPGKCNQTDDEGQREGVEFKPLCHFSIFLLLINEISGPSRPTPSFWYLERFYANPFKMS